jgi:salicylate hydroxylase
MRREAVRAGARILTGQRLASLEDGPAADAGLVVGADGIWSATRRTLDPTTPEPAYAGLYSVSGVSDGRDQEPGSFNMIFARRGAFIHLPAPGGTVWWSAQVASPLTPDLKTVGVEELAMLFRTEERALTVLRATRSVQAATSTMCSRRSPTATATGSC